MGWSTYAGAEQVDEELPERELDALIGLMKHSVHGMTNLQANTPYAPASAQSWQQ